ncbi:MAG: signal peptidase I [Dehalococcoidia bacterium]
MSKIGQSLRRQLFRGFALGLLVVVPAVVLIVTVAATFGYVANSNNGSSMEPTLSDGDAIWVKRVDLAEVRVGDILVAIQRPGEEPIGHRVVSVDPLPGGGYRMVTKGDANRWAEEWEAEPGQTVGVAVAHVPFVGYLVRFAHTLAGRIVLLVTVAALVLALALMRRRRVTQTG